MLIGFTIVAAPLLFAIVNAAVQMNRLSKRSQQLVMHGMQGTRNNQLLFEDIGALERTARLYQIVASADLLDVYAQGLAPARRRGARRSRPAARRSVAPDLGGTAERARSACTQELQTTAPPNSPRMNALIGTYPHMSDLASQHLEPHQRGRSTGN